MNNLPPKDTPPGDPQTSEPPILTDSQNFDPWWRIWFQPRRTFAYLIAVDPKMHFWLLASFYGIAAAVSWAINSAMGDFFTPAEVALFILFGGAASGIFGVFFSGSLLRLVGRVFGGIAESQHVRTVLVWAAVPLNVLTMLSLFPLIGMFGSDVFSSTNPRLQQMLLGQELAADLVGMGLFLWRSALELVGALYYIVLVIIGFAEVEKLSIWKSIGVFVIVYGGLLLMLFLCMALSFLPTL